MQGPRSSLLPLTQATDRTSPSTLCRLLSGSVHPTIALETIMASVPANKSPRSRVTIFGRAGMSVTLGINGDTAFVRSVIHLGPRCQTLCTAHTLVRRSSSHPSSFDDKISYFFGICSNSCQPDYIALSSSSSLPDHRSGSTFDCFFDVFREISPSAISLAWCLLTSYFGADRPRLDPFYSPYFSKRISYHPARTMAFR